MIRTLLLIVVLLLPTPAIAIEGCGPGPITPNTPTGIAGCTRWGDGTASHYGPGNGVAMNFCTWELRHSTGCGWVVIQSHQTGVTVTAAVIDFGDLYTGTPDERIVDLQYGVVEALGLDLADGLYEVTVWHAEGAPSPIQASDSGSLSTVLPDTAVGYGPALAHGTVTDGSGYPTGPSEPTDSPRFWSPAPNLPTSQPITSAGCVTASIRLTLNGSLQPRTTGAVSTTDAGGALSTSARARNTGTAGVSAVAS